MNAAKARARAMAALPQTAAARRDTALRIRLWEIGHSIMADDPSIRQRAARSARKTKLADIPTDQYDTYSFLRRVGKLSIEEAKAACVAQQDADLARFRREMAVRK